MYSSSPMAMGTNKPRGKVNRALMERLRNERRAKGLTLAQVASRIGVKVATPSGWECGRFSIGAKHIRKAAKVYGIPALELVKLCNNEAF
jgi:transcriptional regulator with XRE-family HTH domain